ncbi:MAG: YeaH/YhbH family protein [Oceanospirillales bacterium]|uniref:YeaH/YhbH family protein n=1 Tax=Marinobacter maritimus TaxID=277961 RepID=UPI001ECE297D|nr:YeaH/YhbH family protein [Marinobacter maritimus]MBL1271089.1 YeaH/YhbH family protein [Oceanospirillales bacterium]
MTHIVDRRLNGKNKSAVNRERFLRRYRHHIKKAVSDAVHRRSITDIERGENVSIPSRDTDEPVFHHGQGGHREMVHPGNRDFVAGDRLPKPEGEDGQGQGQGQASPDGDGMDEFAFQITQEEFLNFLFDDLELPNLVRKKLKDTETFNYVRSGFSTQGVPAKLDVIRSLRGAHARRLGLSGARKKKIRELEAQLAELRSAPADLDAAFSHEDQIKALEDEIARLKANVKRIPFIDEIDLRYRQHLKQPKPATSAVMFCLMDVSGSMTQMHKDTAKRFFILLYLFLRKNYKKIDVVFIRHHTSAKEVDEEEFFYSRETGGTIVSSALKLMHKIIESRYSPAEWNIYAAQASDGDNWNDDSPVCGKLLTDRILPLVQYFAYVEITPQDHQMLWYEYERVQERFPESFAQQQISDPSEIYPVFRWLFERKAA